MLRTKGIMYSLSCVVLFSNLAFITECGAPIEFGRRFTYDLNKPDEKFLLEKNLAEVSGLSFISDSVLALVEDEVGSIFFHNLSTNTTTGHQKFSKKGDFEDVETLGNSAYVLRSDGTIYEILNIHDSINYSNTNVYNTILSSQNDTEGLCYNSKSNSLLVGCKGVAGMVKKDKRYHKKKAIYSFNLKTKKLSDVPVILIDENEVVKKSYAASRNGIEKLMSFYNLTPTTPFEPSGMAIHPLTNELYIISSVANLLVITDLTGKIKGAQHLPKQIFKQPEGIVFDSKGNLYISNEGRSGKGNILKFLYEPE